MDYRCLGTTYYLRVDKGEEVISSILKVLAHEDLGCATYSGIGGCASADLMTFDPELGAFSSERLEGMLELVSLNGNVVTNDEGELCHHTHALFAYKEGARHLTRGGHLASTIVRYTAEIEIRPVRDGRIGQRHDPETGTGFWAFE